MTSSTTWPRHADRRQAYSIAARLYLSPRTIRNHVSNIISKLQVTDWTEAIIQARETRLSTKDLNPDSGPSS